MIIRDTRTREECGPLCFGCLRRGQINLVVERKYIRADILKHKSPCKSGNS